MTENQSTSQPRVGIVALPSLARALDAEFDAVSNDQFQVAAKHVTDRLREGSFPVIVSNRGQSALLKTWTRSALRTASAVVVVAFEDGYQDFPEGASVVAAPATIAEILAAVELPAPFNGSDVLSHSGEVETGSASAITPTEVFETPTDDGFDVLPDRDADHTFGSDAEVTPVLPAPPLPPAPAPAPVYTEPITPAPINEVPVVEPEPIVAPAPRAARSRRGAPAQVREAAATAVDEWIYENDPLVALGDLTSESVVGAWYVDVNGVLDENSFEPNPGHVPAVEPGPAAEEPVEPAPAPRIPDFSSFSPNADDAQTVQIPAVPPAPVAPAAEPVAEPVAGPVAERFVSFDEPEAEVAPVEVPIVPVVPEFEATDTFEVPQVQAPEPFVPEPFVPEAAFEEPAVEEPAFVVPGIVPPSVPIVQPLQPSVPDAGNYEGSRSNGHYAADEDNHNVYPEYNDDIIEATSLTAGDNPLSMKPEAEYLNVRNQPHGRGDVVFSWSGKGGVGKAVALDTPIPTPSGFTQMGDLKVGSLVLGRDGKPTTVERVFDHEDLEMFDVRLSDGQVIRACADHRWAVTGHYERVNALSTKRATAIKAWDAAAQFADDVLLAAAPFSDSHTSTLAELFDIVSSVPGNTWQTDSTICGWVNDLSSGTWRATYPTATALKVISKNLQDRNGTTPVAHAVEQVLTTNQMLNAGIKVRTGEKSTSNFAIQMSSPLDLPTATLPVAPYTLGAWLGDGTSADGRFTSIDPEIWESIESDGFAVTHDPKRPHLHNIKGLSALLRAEGLLNNKHIPVEYLRASYDQRLAVLQGVMDTDGSISAAGVCELSLSDKRLATDAVDLIRSLGIKATCSWDQSASYRDDSGEVVVCKDRHRIHFTTTRPVFRLGRKAVRIPTEVRSTQDRLYITSIEPVGQMPGRCITVSAEDHMFLVSGYVPTHNSTIAYSLAQRAALQGKRVVLIDGNFGQGDLRQYLRLTTADIPSIYDATVSKNLKDAFIGPDVINNFRSAGLDDIRFVYVAAPPEHLADPAVVTPELYAAVIAAATHLADLVVVDTQIVETVDSTGMVDRLIAPLLSQRAWGVGVTDLSGPGLANLMRRLEGFSEEGVPASRMLTLLNRIHRDANYNAEKLQAALSKNSTFEGAIFDDYTIHNQMNLGHTVAEMPTLAPMLDHILGRIAGQQPPQVALSSGPPAPKAKRRFFGRNKS